MQQWHTEEARLRQNELLQEARHYRLSRLSRTGRKQSPRPRPRAFIWFGGQLIAWGNQLQGCYETPGTRGSRRLSGAMR